ncbi:MAG TPA: desulfoferrodoxin [Candidatus Methanomethylophilaceae archaeon]|nr:desulfoferrodoxin [Candidatus Methanomethylophilaceae archaeon]
MAKIRSVYHCEKCGKIVEVLFEGKGNLDCCKTPMVLLEPQTEDYANEKHVPYIEKVDGGVLVKVGKETAHPMVDDHYIAYIEICADGVLLRKYLKPGNKPEAYFETDAKNITARELCNIHGVWKSNQ